jgi:hypothetical protein
MQLAMESCTSQSDAYLTTNEGWLTDGEKITIKWEENMTEVRKKLAYKKPPLLNKCSCKNCSVTGRGCTQCAKACKPCTSKCKCKGLCNNPHNNGGTCYKCSETVANTVVPQPGCSEPRQHQQQDTAEDLHNESEDSDSEDSEEEFDVEESQGAENIIDFDGFFGGSGENGMLQLAPISSLGDSDSDDSDDEGF